MALGDLRPQAKGAARRTSAPGVHRDVGILAVGAVVFQVVEIVFVDFGDERQLVEFLVGELRAVGVVMNRAVLAIRDSAYLAPIPALRHFDHRVVELAPPGDVDRGRDLERLLGLRGGMAADEGNDAIGIGGLDRLGRARVHPQRRSRGVEHHEVVVLGFVDRALEVVTVRRSVEQARSRNHPGRVGQPGRIPERPDLARGLVARPRTTVKVLIGRRIQEKRLHHVHILVVSTSLSDWLVRLYKPRRAQAITSEHELLAKKLSVGAADYWVRGFVGSILSS